MDLTPDLSHLTDDEKKIIEAVLYRQKAEEQHDAFNLQSRIDDYSSPPSIAISSRRSSQSNESGVLCQICQKTKFVNEQSSRQCSICQKRFCVRCGIRLKPQYYLCNQCRQKQEHYFSSTKNICKQYLSDYILSQTLDENQMNKHGSNQQRILPKPKIDTHNDDEASSPESVATCDRNKRLLPVIRQDMRSMNILRDFQYHSLEDREIGQESTLKDSGIDTASSSTILNVISSDKFQKPMTYWRFNDTRTEQTGYVYLKNNLSTYEREHGKVNKTDILNALGLKIQGGIHYENEDIAEVTKVVPGSVADAYGQLRVGDQVLEWNGEKLTNLSSHEVNRIISRISIQSPQIHIIVKRSIRPAVVSNIDRIVSNQIAQDDQTILSTTETSCIQLQLSFQYEEKDLHIMIYGARNIPIRQGLLACQLSLQYERDRLSQEEKCTKGQSCSSGICTWNQHMIFFDMETIDNILLWIKLINLEHNQEILGEIQLSQFNLNEKSEWYNLNEISHEPSLNRVLPSITDIPPSTTTTARKRQLPVIPTDKLNANREKMSLDLHQKAARLKLDLLMQTKNDKSLITQHSFDDQVTLERQIYDDHSRSNDDNPKKSTMSLASSSTSKDKLRIPMLRDGSVPNSTLNSRRTTMSGSNTIDIKKTKMKSLEDKYRKSIRKRHSSETPGDDIDSDGSELSSASKISSTSAFSTQSERPRHLRKHSAPRQTHGAFYQNNEVQLNEEELRQMSMRTHETTTNPTVNQAAPTTATSSTVSHEKINKPNQRNDGTVSDSALSSQGETNKKRPASMPSKALVMLGLSKKGNSASNVNLTKRYGFQRSEEVGVQHHLRNRSLEQQTSKENVTPSSAPPRISSQSPFSQREQPHSVPPDITKLWSGGLKLPHEHQFTDFIEGLGKGQLVGRQVLASPCHGEIQIGLRNQQGLLEVEIVRARNLPQKAYYKMPPAPYVKVYLLDGKTCIEKQRTRPTRRTLDPLIQQTLLFKESFREKVLQISIWGDYGKLDRKVFMGVCQISLDEVNLNTSQQTLDWYKLFSANSLMNNYTIVQQSSKRKNTIS